LGVAVGIEDEELAREGDPKKALEALEWASERAERGEGASELLIKATRRDFQVASEKYVEDLRGHLDRIIMSRDAEAGLDALLESGALAALLPEVSAMVGFGDGEWRHKDVWKHTKQVVRQAVPRLEIRWAALLHDIGKMKTRSISPTGEVHFFGHAEVGARMFDKMNRRLPIFRRDDALRDTVRFLILHHLRASQYDASWTDSAVRRFAREMGPLLDDVLCLSRADITTKRPEKKKKGLRQISDLGERVRTLAEEDAVVPPLPSGIGDAIMTAFGLAPSRLVGDIKRALEKAVEDGSLAAHQPAEFYVAHLAENRERFGLPR
jgi:poly(A) polymerase